MDASSVSVGFGNLFQSNYFPLQAGGKMSLRSGILSCMS